MGRRKYYTIKMEIIISIIALLAGLAIGYFMGRSSVPSRESEIQSLKETLQEKEENYDQVIAQKEKDREEIMRNMQMLHNREVAGLKESHKQLIDKMEENQAEALRQLKNQFEETSKSMSSQLQVVTEQMLKQRQTEFSQTSSEKIGNILKPLEMSLKAMQDKVAQNSTQQAELGGKLSESIANLLQHTESAQASAEKLAAMLKGNSKHQGEWGERILKEILEALNLQEGIHFDLQHTFTDARGQALKNEEGRMGRPDVILHIDQNKDVIIDSKVSLSAYLDYLEAETDETRQDALKRHITSLEKHVAELVKKDYLNYIKPPRERLGYVIMFVPNTNALLLATQTKPTLWREAMEKNVYIADEQTLYAALKIVSLTWRQISQNANHAEVFKLAEEMINRVAAFTKSYNEIGDVLNKAVKSYKEGKKKLEEGGQSIPQTCRKLIQLGAKPPKPQKGVDASLFNLDEDDLSSEENNRYLDLSLD